MLRRGEGKKCFKNSILNLLTPSATQWNDMHNIQITKLGAMLQEEGRLFNYNSLPSTLPTYLLTCIT